MLRRQPTFWIALVTHFDEMDEDAWDNRETFAYFGRAFYCASVLEVGLAHAVLFSEFMHGVKERDGDDGGTGFDRARYEADFDKFVEQQFAQTMGSIMRKVAVMADISDALKTRIVEAKKRRDYLTHHFWRERGEDAVTRKGRASMRAELEADMKLFEEVDWELDAELKRVRARIGIKDEWLEAHYRRNLARLKSADE